MSLFSFLLLYTQLFVLNSDIIYRNTVQDTTDAICNSFPCEIYCNVDQSCYSVEISCPSSNLTGTCTITLYGAYAAQYSVFNIGTATELNINVNDAAYGALDTSTIHANTVGSKLNILIGGADNVAHNAIVYAPYGKGSELNIDCGNDFHDYVCAWMSIYEDYSTTVYLRSFSVHGFYQTQIRNIFNYNHIHHLNVSRPNSTIIHPNYRASVHLYSSISDNGFTQLLYEGTDHGNWTIMSEGVRGFSGAVIYADHSFITNESYHIAVSGQTEQQSIEALTLYASQNNAHITLVGYSDHAFSLNPSNSFTLICNKHASLFVIDTLEITAITAPMSFAYCFINITNDIRNVIISGWAHNGLYQSTYVFGGVILNDAVFRVHNDYQAFRFSNISMQRVDGNVQFINHPGSGLGFMDCSFAIHGVGGNISFADDSSVDGQAFRYSVVTVHEVGGNVYFVSNAAAIGSSFSGSLITLKNISGDVQFTDNSASGRPFAQTQFDIDYVGGSLCFEAKFDNTKQAFDGCTFDIGIVHGNLSFIANTYGAFSECDVNVTRVHGITKFLGGNTGSEFYHSSFTISSCPYIVYETNYLNALWNSNHSFGADVGVVHVTIKGGTTVQYSSIWDCRNCDEFMLKCNNNAECGNNVQIYCPENNANNKCNIYCDAGSACDNMDIFTSNGYCRDVEFVCTDDVMNTCLMSGSKVICTTNTNNEYGVQSLSYCNMQQMASISDPWVCDDYMDSTCNNLCTDVPTTAQPTTVIPTTNRPTTLPPTTSQPTTLRPTAVTTAGVPITSTSSPTTNGPTTAIPSGTSLDVNDYDGEQRETTLTDIFVSNSEVKFITADSTLDMRSIIMMAGIVIGIICIVLVIVVMVWKHKNKDRHRTDVVHVSDGITTDLNQMERMQSNSSENTKEKVIELIGNRTPEYEDGDIETEQLYVEPIETPGIDITTGGEVTAHNNIDDENTRNDTTTTTENNDKESESSEKLYDQVNTTTC